MKKSLPSSRPWLCAAIAVNLGKMKPGRPPLSFPLFLPSQLYRADIAREDGSLSLFFLFRGRGDTPRGASHGPSLS